ALQLNDSGYVLDQRQMSVEGVVGILPMGLPILASTPFLLTYDELWNGQAVLAGQGHPLPQQIAVGDMGISAAGIRWGNPLFYDMYIAGLTGFFPGLVGFAAAAPFTLLPRAWILNPVWASVFFTPIDPSWSTGLTAEQL